MHLATRIRALYFGLSAVIIAVLLYQQLELRWYRDQSMHLLANRLSTSLRMARTEVERALEQGRQGDREAASQWLAIAEVELAGASVAESGYSLALDRRFAREQGHSTGFGMTIRVYGSTARSARIDLARSGWTLGMETQLSAMAHDLNLIGNLLTEDLLNRADYSEIRSGAAAVKQQLKTSGVPD